MKTALRRRGFTLIEMLAVIAIIGILAGLLLGVLHKARQRSLRLKAATETRDLVKACQEYFVTYGKLPFSGVNIPMNGVNVGILQGDDVGMNPQKIKFYQFPVGADINGFMDPWKQMYHMSLDTQKATNNWSYATRVYFQHRRRCQYE